MKLLLRYFTVICCILAACGAQAQHYSAGDFEKLGLTFDQKTKLEAIRKDVESQSNAYRKDRTLSHEQRAAKWREMEENEDTRVNSVLTVAQQQHLKDLLFPENQWRVNGYIFPGNDLSHYNVRLDSYPPQKYLSYVIQKKNIRLSVLDSTNKLVPNGFGLILAPDVLDTISPVTDKEGFDFAKLELILDRKTAKAGCYKFIFTAPVEAIDAQTKERIKIPDARAESWPQVYLTPQPDAEPALVIGQRFIGNPWDAVTASTLTPYKDTKSGKQITWREIATKIVTLQRVEPTQGGNRLTFVLEGHTGQIYVETEYRATDLQYLTPLLTEPTVRTLKAQYEGKPVWRYGGSGGQCVSTEPGMEISMSGSMSVPLRVRHVERVYLAQKTMAIGNATFLGGERKSAFVTDNPLVVILDMPAKGLEFNCLSYVGTEDVEQMSIVSDPRAHCLGLWNMVSDRWDFEREYSLQSPMDIGRNWPAKMRKAVLKGELVKGMTPEMVAWGMGWPSIYGTKSQMLHYSDWTYDNIPYSGHIYFKNGRMTGQDWPRLP